MTYTNGERFPLFANDGVRLRGVRGMARPVIVRDDSNVTPQAGINPTVTVLRSGGSVVIEDLNLVRSGYPLCASAPCSALSLGQQIEGAFVEVRRVDISLNTQGARALTSGGSMSPVKLSWKMSPSMAGRRPPKVFAQKV